MSGTKFKRTCANKLCNREYIEDVTDITYSIITISKLIKLSVNLCPYCRKVVEIVVK